MTGRPIRESSQDAIQRLQAAISRNPADVASLNQLGSLFYSSSRPGDALACFQRAVRLLPRDAILRQNEAMALIQLGQPEPAIAALRTAISLDPSQSSFFKNLAGLLLQLGRADEAVPLLRRGAELEPHDYERLVQLGQALIESGEVKEAEVCLLRAIESLPDDGAAQELLGNLYSQLGRFDEARSIFDSAVKAGVKRKGIFLPLATSRKMTQGDLPLIGQMRSVLENDTLSPEDRNRIHFALGKSYNDLGEYGEAMSQFDLAQEQSEQQLRQRNQAFDPRQCVQRFDEIISKFSGEALGKPRKASESAMPLFVVGMIRSGTTLVEQMLTRHHKISAAGELSFWPQRWRSVMNVGGVLDQAALERLEREYLQLLRTLAPDSERVTDKMPGNYIALGAIYAVFPNAKVIACRRHSIDNAISIYTTAFGTGHPWIHKRENIVCFYRQYQRLMRHWRSILPESFMLEVEYEDLVANPESVGRKMIEFVKLEWDSACLSPEQNPRIVRTPSQWQVRQPIYQSSVERWRRYEPWLGALKTLGDSDS